MTPKRKYSINQIQNAAKKFFINAKIIHNNFYDYSKFNYTFAIEKSIIICPIHGDFLQNPHSHLSGKGCIECGRIKTGKSNAQTKELFIKKANNKFNNKYDYNNMEFVNNVTHIEIKCFKHGSFWQQPAYHLQSSGCPKCIFEKNTGMYNLKNAELNKVKWNKIPAKYYLIKCTNNNEIFYKLGITVKDKIKYRFGKLPYKYNILNIIKTNLYDAIILEQLLLKKMNKYKYIPLIKFKGYTECIKLSVNQINKFQKYLIDKCH